MANKKEIDWERVTAYAEAGANQKEIAGSLRISENTLRKRALEDLRDEDGEPMQLSTFLGMCDSKGIADIKLKQHERGMDGNSTLLIWNGKQRANQTDKSSISQTTFSATASIDFKSFSLEQIKMLRDDPSKLQAFMSGQTALTIEHKQDENV